MTNALIKKLSTLGLTSLPEPSPRSKVGKLFRSAGVPKSRELARIRQLPSRTMDPTSPTLYDIAEEMTREFRTADGTMALRPLQAAALVDLHDFRGLLASLRVGAGKTLVTFLAPTILSAERPLLIVPAALKKKTANDFDELRKHWIGPASFEDYPIFSYEALARENRAAFLAEYRPDLIVCDEAHRLKNAKAAITRRIRRYMHERPETLFVGLSGTLTTRSLRDFGHLSEWALKDLSPLPRTFGELFEWAMCVDEKIENTRARQRPGALESLFDDDDRTLAATDEIAAARRAVGRRVAETPGVVSSGSDVVPISLIVEEDAELCAPKAHAFNCDRTDPTTCWACAFACLDKWQLPDGEEIAEAADHWRHTRELGQGFYYTWETQPPREWREARRTWARECREVLKNNRRSIDTQAQLASAILRGEYDGDPCAHAYAVWRDIRDTFEPVTVPRWISFEYLEYVMRKARELPHAIVWVEQRAVGHALSSRFGLPYFQAMGLDDQGRAIEEIDPEREPIIVASIASCGTGRNLQRWAHNVMTCSPPNGALWEQLLGRTHRDGQEADEVTMLAIHGTAQSIADVEQARRDAEYVERTTGQPQKLAMATRIMV